MTAVASGAPGPLLKDAVFRRYFTAVAASTMGTQIGMLAVPLVAVIALDASPWEVGVLGATSTVAFLLIGLPAGAWLDRVRKRRVMLFADLARALLMLSVPAAAGLGVLTMAQLYVVVFLNGVATVFFDVGSQSFLPSVISRDHLVAANSGLASWDAGMSIAGPSITGLLVQLIAPPVALVVNGVAYLFSTFGLATVRAAEPAPTRTSSRMARDVREGTSFVLGNPILAPIAISGASTNFFIKIGMVVLPLVFIRELHLGEIELGVFLAVGGLGVLVGSVTARPLASLLGVGRSLWVVGLLTSPLGLLVGVIGYRDWVWLGAVGWFAVMFRAGSRNVITVSIRQQVTPDGLLGRMNATMRVFITGALAVGALAAGILGQLSGLQVTLWIVAIGVTASWLPTLVPAIRTMKGLPERAHENRERA